MSINKNEPKENKNNLSALLKSRYGVIAMNPGAKPVWAQERDWMTLVVLPKVAHTIINTATGKPWDKIYCSKDIAKPLVNTIELLHFKELLKEIKTFDGCFNIRHIRGEPGALSLHSYGIAVDFNAAENQLGQDSKLSVELINVFLQMGWTWGGAFKRKDPMHFEYTRQLMPISVA